MRATSAVGAVEEMAGRRDAGHLPRTVAALWPSYMRHEQSNDEGQAPPRASHPASHLTPAPLLPPALATPRLTRWTLAPHSPLPAPSGALALQALPARRRRRRPRAAAGRRRRLTFHRCISRRRRRRGGRRRRRGASARHPRRRRSRALPGPSSRRHPSTNRPTDSTERHALRLRRSCTQGSPSVGAARRRPRCASAPHGASLAPPPGIFLQAPPRCTSASPSPVTRNEARPTSSSSCSRSRRSAAPLAALVGRRSASTRVEHQHQVSRLSLRWSVEDVELRPAPPPLGCKRPHAGHGPDSSCTSPRPRDSGSPPWTVLDDSLRAKLDEVQELLGLPPPVWGPAAVLGLLLSACAGLPGCDPAKSIAASLRAAHREEVLAAA